MGVVEKVKGARWQEFSGARGDWGRAAACYIARKHAGMTLREIGDAAGGIDYGAVSMMLKRFEKRLESDANVRRRITEAEELLNVKTRPRAPKLRDPTPPTPLLIPHGCLVGRPTIESKQEPAVRRSLKPGKKNLRIQPFLHCPCSGLMVVRG